MERIGQILYLVISLLIVIADQELKNYIATNFKINDKHTVIPGILPFTYLQNNGAAWNISSGQMILFYLISIAATAIVVCYLFSPKYKNWLFNTGPALILGRIIGNFIDQLHLEYVIDMLQSDFIQLNTFNIAGNAITVGIVLAFVYLAFMSEKG